jgi:hypothetical protein
MSLVELVQAAQKYFPDLRIDYKSQSSFMKLLGRIMFFNKNFMTSYTTTIDSTVYFPNALFVKIRPVSSSIIILHELVHLYDSNKWGKRVFDFLYLFPQSLVPLSIPLLIVNWHISLFFLLFILPFPALFRTYFELRAYMATLYVTNAISIKLNLKSTLDVQKEDLVSQFNSSSYYFMFPFTGYIRKRLDAALVKIKAGQRPFESPVFDMLDELVKTI